MKQALRAFDAQPQSSGNGQSPIHHRCTFHLRRARSDFTSCSSAVACDRRAWGERYEKNRASCAQRTACRETCKSPPASTKRHWVRVMMHCAAAFLLRALRPPRTCRGRHPQSSPYMNTACDTLRAWFPPPWPASSRSDAFLVSSMFVMQRLSTCYTRAQRG